MAVRLTPIGWIAKFVVVPAALAALGFYVIGPRIGVKPPTAKKPAPQDSTDSPSDAPASPQPSGAPKIQDHAPDGVQVTVKPVESDAPNLGQDSDATASTDSATEDTPKPRKRRHSKPPQSLAAPPTDPTPDDGGSAGDAGSPQPVSGTTGTTTGG